MRSIWVLIVLFSFLNGGIGKVAAVKGGVEIHRSSATTAAKIGSVIEAGDAIYTKKDGKTQVILNDDTVVTIGNNSMYIFKEYLKDKKSNSKMSMELKKGYFRIITGKIGKLAPDRFKVKTRHATIGIRGTDFYDQSEEKFEEAGCLRGIISVDTGGKIYILQAGEKAVFKDGKWKVVKKGVKKNANGKKPLGENDPVPDLQKDQVAEVSRATTHTVTTPSFGITGYPGGTGTTTINSPLWR